MPNIFSLLPTITTTSPSTTTPITSTTAVNTLFSNDCTQTNYRALIVCRGTN